MIPDTLGHLVLSASQDFTHRAACVSPAHSSVLVVCNAETGQCVPNVQQATPQPIALFALSAILPLRLLHSPVLYAPSSVLVANSVKIIPSARYVQLDIGLTATLLQTAVFASLIMAT